MALLEGRDLETPLLPSVRQWIDWKITGSLPNFGGTLDQSPEFMRDLRIISSIEAQWEKIGRHKAGIKGQIKGNKK